MNKTKFLTAVIVVLIVGASWSYVMYLYNTLTLDPQITIIDAIDAENVEAYDEFITDELLIGKPSLILINNGWTKDRLLKLDHPKVFNNCNQEGWNLMYLSNEFGDQEYNRSRPNWLNRICRYKMLGYHLYISEPFELFDKYIRKETSTTGQTYSFPHVLISNSEGIITDTLYNYQNSKLYQLIK